MIEIRHTATGLAKTFDHREAVGAFLAEEADPHAWEGWQCLNLPVADKVPAPAAPAPKPPPAPVAAPAAPKTKAPAKKAVPAKKAAKK